MQASRKFGLRARFILVCIGVGLGIFLMEVGFRIFYLKLPYSLQVKTSGARLWGLGGPPLGQLINSLDFYQTCLGDERLYARILPDLNEVPVLTGPGNVWHVTSLGLGFENIGFRTTDSNGPWDGVVLGDSFGFCLGVEYQECWVHQLAEKTQISLANLSVSGTGSVSHLRYLEDYGWSLNPRIVIWQFQINDPIDDYHHMIKGVQGCPRPQIDKVPTSEKLLGGFRDWLSHTFVSYNLVLSPVLRKIFPKLAGPQPSQTQYEQVITSNNQELLVFNTINDPEDIRLSDGLGLTTEAILSAARQAEEREIQFLLVLVPENLQVYEDFLLEDRLITSAKASDAIIDNLIDFANKYRIQYVDLRPESRQAAGQGREFYQPYDTHWNIAGNRFVAELLSERVAELLNSP